MAVCRLIHNRAQVALPGRDVSLMYQNATLFEGGYLLPGVQPVQVEVRPLLRLPPVVPLSLKRVLLHGAGRYSF